MSRTFVLADVHGRWELAKRALIAAGAVSYDRTTGTIRGTPGVTIVQLGDLLNCTKDSVEADIECLRHASIFDYVLVGNHEYPYWHNGPTSTFSGFHWSDDVLKAIEPQRWRFKPAKAVGDILITHAGLSREYEGIWNTAGAAAAVIDKIWRTNPADRLFSGIGRSRGGRERYGGITWSDWSEAKTRTFTQIMGHTVGKKIRKRLSTSQNTQQICIDLGARSGVLAGAWIDVEYQKPVTVTEMIYDSGNRPKEEDEDSFQHRHIWVKRPREIGGHKCPCGVSRECPHPMCACTGELLCAGVEPAPIVA